LTAITGVIAMPTGVFITTSLGQYCHKQGKDMHDMVIRGGTVVDGTSVRSALRNPNDRSHHA
jgi:hypothetical protein